MAEHTPAPTPTRGVYGFALFLLFKTLFIIYIFWAYVPINFLEDTLGLTYFPNKYFATFIPILILAAVTLFAFFIYPSLGLSMTLRVDDSSTIRDKFTIVRCKHQIKCENKIAQSNKTWKRNELCLYHKNGLNPNLSDFKINGNIIEEYCDCTDFGSCLLKNSKVNYFDTLQKRKTVPTVWDLDLSEVCRQLYLNHDNLKNR